MKHLICHLSLLTLLAAWAAGCQKTDLQETCPQPDVYLLSYSIDASVGCDTLHGRQALVERVQTLVAMTDDGHSIRIWEPDRGQTPHTKEVVTFDTCSREVADQWALEMYLQGYAVEITKIDGIYHCEAVKAAAADPQTLTSLAGTQWVGHEDYMMHVAGTGDVHVVKDVTLTFLTDSTGTRNTKVVGGDLPADADFTCGITYSYNAETGVCEWVDERSGQEPSLQYDLQRKALVNEYWAFYKVE